MTWKKTKVMRLLREGKHWASVRLMRPYNPRHYRAEGLPPGWQRMCKAVGLRPDASHQRDAKVWLNLTCAGRRWRVNASRNLDVSCPYADFDRWANSTAKSFPIPRNKTELELYVRFTQHDT
jgi:hypothetical protein